MIFFLFQQKSHNDEYRDIMIKTIQDHSHKPYKRQKKNRTAQNELKQKISLTSQAKIDHIMCRRSMKNAGFIGDDPAQG